MRTLRAWLLRATGLFTHTRRDRELAAELDAHLQMHIDDNLRSGMTPEQARREAALKLGGLQATREAYRDRASVPFIEHMLQDTRFALRQLRKNPGFTATAVVVLALGICASVSIFAFVDAALVKPLPYKDPATLVGAYESVPMIPRANLSYADYQDWKRMNVVFSSLDVFRRTGFHRDTPNGVERARGALISAGFFATLGVTPTLGRDFRVGEDKPGAPRIVILSHGGWQNYFGGRQDVLGNTLRLDGESFVVVGVLPQTFHFAPAEPADVWIPLQPTNQCDVRRSCHAVTGVARLKPGVTIEAALANVKSIAKQLEQQYPDSNRGQAATLAPLTDVIVGDLRPLFLGLWTGAGLLLLIAAVNVAGLLLVRSEGRSREFAVRNALGASASRLTGLFTAEALVLATAACGIALVLSYWATQILLALIPANMLARMPFLKDLGVNFRTAAFAIAVAFITALLFTAIPALRVRFGTIRQGLAEGSRGSAGLAWSRLGSKLVVLELVMAVVLLVSAGLLGKSLYHLLHVELGFDPDHLAAVEVAAPDAKYGKDPQTIAFARTLIRRVEALPGVQSAAVSSVLPVNYNGNTDWIRLVGHPYHGEHNDVNMREVSSDYFATIRAKLLRGRVFSDSEDQSKPRVVVINQTLARMYFHDEDPVGQRIGDIKLSPGSIKEIIGVIDDIREGGLDAEIWPAVYYPFNQSPSTYFGLIVRTSQQEQSVLESLRQCIREIDRDVLAIAPKTMNEFISNSQPAYIHRSATWLVGGFAGLALFLSVVGLYGVVTYSVSQRTREIGVRMALGAEGTAIYKLILSDAGTLTALGIVIGLACAVGAATLMRKMLFGVHAWDAGTLGSVAVLLAISALAASFFPARRAASVNPTDALRAE